jgi:two-component system sensor histidine kinase KdpD
VALERRVTRLALTFAGVALITWIAYDEIPVNSSTVGFAYLLFVLIIASTLGFLEALVTSFLATATLNFFFLEPKFTFTIEDPQNWVALFSFMVTALIASRLSTKARQRALDAIERQRYLERLYTFGRAILLIQDTEPFARQLARKLADTFELGAVVLYDPRVGEIYRAGPMEFDGMDSQLREAAVQGTTFSDATRNRIVFGVQLGSSPIASLALQGARMPDSVLQSIGNLVAIGLERARAQELGHEVEVARRSEQLRTTLLDALAHELKTPLTSIRAATSALLANADRNAETAGRMLKIADEEAAHLEELIDNALDLAQLDSRHIQVHLEPANLDDAVRDVVDSMKDEIADRRIVYKSPDALPAVPMDRRLLKLAVRQLLDNALKYSPVGTPVTLQTFHLNGTVGLEVTDAGKGIPQEEQRRVFERFYRSSSVQDQIPGSGLGLSIARRILEAHKGTLALKSRPGETTFRLALPVNGEEEKH